MPTHAAMTAKAHEIASKTNQSVHSGGGLVLLVTPWSSKLEESSTVNCYQESTCQPSGLQTWTSYVSSE